MAGELASANPFSRTATAVRRHGVGRAAVRAIARGTRGAARRMFLAERHVWFEIPAGGGPPPAPPDGYRVRRGDRGDAEALAALGVMNGAAARGYLDDGDQLWVGTHGDELVYSVWLHRARVPAVATRGGWMRLPARVLCLEGAYAMPGHRHLGVGRCAVRHALAANLADGYEHVVARVAEDNIASRKSVAKLGGREFARMRFLRVGPWRRIRIQPAGDQPLATALERALQSGAVRGG